MAAYSLVAVNSSRLNKEVGLKFAKIWEIWLFNSNNLVFKFWFLFVFLSVSTFWLINLRFALFSNYIEAKFIKLLFLNYNLKMKEKLSLGLFFSFRPILPIIYFFQQQQKKNKTHMEEKIKTSVLK